MPDYWDLDPHHPDYTATEADVAVFSIKYTVDRYNQRFISMGPAIGVGFSSNEGWIGSGNDDQIPNWAVSKDFHTGKSFSANAGFGLVGLGVIWSPGKYGTRRPKFAWETGTYYLPGFGVGESYGFPLR